MSALIGISGADVSCPPGRFHLDPPAPVETAIVTHFAAAEGARGSGTIITTPAVAELAGLGRVGVRRVDLEERATLEGVRVRLRPSGGGLGACLAEVSDGGERWVYAGLHRRVADPTCPPCAEIVADRLVLNTRYGLPVYRWGDPARRLAEVSSWWRENADAGRASVLLCEATGKAQRILARLVGRVDRPVRIHAELAPAVEAYRRRGVLMCETLAVEDVHRRHRMAGELILAPPEVYRTPWVRRLGGVEVARASGEMQLRGSRRRLGVDRGFVLSDHPDWTELMQTAEGSDVDEVLTIGAHAEVVARYLAERGRTARALAGAGAVLSSTSALAADRARIERG